MKVSRQKINFFGRSTLINDVFAVAQSLQNVNLSYPNKKSLNAMFKMQNYEILSIGSSEL